MIRATIAELSSPEAFTADICIVGSGPAGLTIARELAAQRLKVLILESGRLDREDEFSAALNAVETCGAPRVADQSRLRNRIFGGSSHTWSGRCTTLDDLDFERRPWIADSGWPIAPAALAPFADRAAGPLGLVPTQYDETLAAALKLSHRFADKTETPLRSIYWQFSRDPQAGHGFMRFGPNFLRSDLSDVTVVTGATVTEIRCTSNGGRVSGLTARNAEGVTLQVTAQYFVLCAGGIENPRLLLASNRQQPHGLGNARGLVGRYLMDHPRTKLGRFAPEQHARILAEFGVLPATGGMRMQRGLSLSRRVIADEHLVNAAAWAVYDFAEDDLWSALKAARMNGSATCLRQAGLALRHADQVLAGLSAHYLRKRPLPRRLRHLDLDVTLEQVPDPDSRITLGETRDAFGTPRARIDWRISDRERRTAVYLGEAIGRSFADAGLPVPVLQDWVNDNRPEDAVFYDVAHPTGTTRMARTPEEGVVDQDCKVFDVDNLYIAGSSVFPTGGHANPTLTIVALAIRLADTIKLRCAA
jgi:choline dehydrogenase-like flavoprotein